MRTMPFPDLARTFGRTAGRSDLFRLCQQGDLKGIHIRPPRQCDEPGNGSSKWHLRHPPNCSTVSEPSRSPTVTVWLPAFVASHPASSPLVQAGSRYLSRGYSRVLRSRQVVIYDTVNSYQPGTQPDFYLGVAEELGAETVIDLGCGTGIVTLKFAVGAIG